MFTWVHRRNYWGLIFYKDVLNNVQNQRKTINSINTMFFSVSKTQHLCCRKLTQEQKVKVIYYVLFNMTYGGHW